MRTLACGAIVAAALATAVPVAAKEGMTATLLSRVSIGAMPGTTMRIAWRIDEKSASAASDDDRFYVRLDSATGARGTRRAASASRPARRGPAGAAGRPPADPRAHRTARARAPG